MTIQQRHVARRVAANICVRCPTPLTAREIGKVQRCRACRLDETTKAKRRYRETKRKAQER